MGPKSLAIGLWLTHKSLNNPLASAPDIKSMKNKKTAFRPRCSLSPSPKEEKKQIELASFSIFQTGLSSFLCQTPFILPFPPPPSPCPPPPPCWTPHHQPILSSHKGLTRKEGRGRSYWRMDWWITFSRSSPHPEEGFFGGCYCFWLK